MIKLIRPQKPIELSEKEQKELTQEYFESKKSKSVWNRDYIRRALLDSTNGKCCYCEKKIGSGKTDMHIDHFKPKSKYPDSVVEWDNLMPSCPDCNRSKNDHDTVEKSIVNPYVDNPKEYFYLKLCRYKAIDHNPDSKANTTINVLDLNDSVKKMQSAVSNCFGIIGSIKPYKFFCKALSIGSFNLG